MVGFRQLWRRGEIRRETSSRSRGLSTGGFSPPHENVAVYNQSHEHPQRRRRHRPLPRPRARRSASPSSLADSRELGDLDGSSQNPQRLQDPTGAQLFTVPYKSPTRSGIDWFSVGLDFAT